MEKLSLIDIYANSQRTGIIIIPDDVDNIPNVIWNYNLCEQLKSATSSKYRSAVLTKTYLGGMMNGQPFKRSYVFMFYGDLPPTPQSKAVASITFTIDLRDGTLRFVESPMEF